jgi:hypothetical protein
MADRSLQPVRWSHGARVVVLLSFDVDNDTIRIARSERRTLSPATLNLAPIGDKRRHLWCDLQWSWFRSEYDQSLDPDRSEARVVR